MRKNLEGNIAIGKQAIRALKTKTEILDSTCKLYSTEDSEADLEGGQDYILSFSDGRQVGGSHRHMKKIHEDYFCLRYSLPSGAPTEVQKLSFKPAEYNYSFSWGWIKPEMKVCIVTAEQFRNWFEAHKNVESYLEEIFNDGNIFIKIPITDITSYKTL